MQIASSRIWTQAAVSIFYDSNHYTTIIYIYIYIYISYDNNHNTMSGYILLIICLQIIL